MALGYSGAGPIGVGQLEPDAPKASEFPQPLDMGRDGAREACTEPPVSLGSGRSPNPPIGPLLAPGRIRGGGQLAHQARAGGH